MGRDIPKGEFRQPSYDDAFSSPSYADIRKNGEEQGQEPTLL